MNAMNILVTVDAKYAPHVRTLLKSLFSNNPGEAFHIYLIHDDLDRRDLDALEAFCANHQSLFIPILLDDRLFDEAPVKAYYTRAMYYRLLAAHILPEELDKALYLDPDILVINPVRPLYDLNMENSLFAAASHAGLTKMVTMINRVRLGNFQAEAYFNSGVLLLNLNLQRSHIRRDEIFGYMNANRRKLILPDQDVLNGLYWDRILLIDECLYNYDPRSYFSYLVGSGGVKNMEWVLSNTVLIHYCGKSKPWNKNTGGPFAALYKHYMRRAHPASTQIVREPASYEARPGTSAVGVALQSLAGVKHFAHQRSARPE